MEQKLIAQMIRRMESAEKDPLQPLLDEYIINRDKSKKRYVSHTIPIVDAARMSGVLSPSSICGCERQAAMKFMGVKGKRREDPDLGFIFNDGTWRHHRWQATFKDMQEVLGKKTIEVLGIEQFIEIPSLGVAGHLDILVLIEGKLLVIEIKGINDRGFNYVLTQGTPMLPHRRQGITYAKGSKAEGCVVLYDNKNNQQTKSFLVGTKGDEWKAIRRWCKDVLAAIETHELPPMSEECTAGNFLYESCQYSRLCYGALDDDALRRRMYRKVETRGS